MKATQELDSFERALHLSTKPGLASCLSESSASVESLDSECEARFWNASMEQFAGSPADNRVGLQARGERKADAGVPMPQRLAVSFRPPVRSLAYCGYCILMLTVAVLLAGLGSGVTTKVAAFSVITVPDGAVTFTAIRIVHVVFGVSHAAVVVADDLSGSQVWRMRARQRFSVSG
jgi:hypothetical protein